jgi:F-type H+-transporting ATPase subunit gamma
MPSLIDIRRRIRSVKNTEQITKAMKMISAAKLRRAQDRVIASRPYAEMMNRMLQNVARAAAQSDEASEHPLMERRPEKKIELLVVTADRGLAGGFNANVIREALKFIRDHSGAEVSLQLMGRKGRDYFRTRHRFISGEYTTLFQRSVDHAEAAKIARKVMERFIKQEIDAVYVAGNQFKSMMSSEMVLIKILPVEIPEGNEEINYIYEQPPAELLGSLLPRYVEMQVYKAMIESFAAEHAARMTAMDAASRNAGEMIEKLTLNLNRVRQASITREIIEIVSGAAALS